MEIIKNTVTKQEYINFVNSRVKVLNYQCNLTTLLDIDIPDNIDTLDKLSKEIKRMSVIIEKSFLSHVKEGMNEMEGERLFAYTIFELRRRMRALCEKEKIDYKEYMEKKYGRWIFPFLYKK